MQQWAAHLGDIGMAVPEEVRRKLYYAALPSVMLCRLAAHDAGHHLEHLSHTLGPCIKDPADQRRFPEATLVVTSSPCPMKGRHHACNGCVAGHSTGGSMNRLSACLHDSKRGH